MAPPGQPERYSTAVNAPSQEGDIFVESILFAESVLEGGKVFTTS
jgi:hypothetical protein